MSWNKTPLKVFQADNNIVLFQNWWEMKRNTIEEIEHNILHAYQIHSKYDAKKSMFVQRLFLNIWNKYFFAFDIISLQLFLHAHEKYPDKFVAYLCKTFAAQLPYREKNRTTVII